MRPAYSRGAGDARPITGAAIHLIPRRHDRRNDVIQGPKTVTGQERVDVRQGGSYSSGEGFEWLGGLSRVYLDDVVGEPAQLGHCITEEIRSIAFPAIADDDDDGATGRTPSPVSVDEGPQGQADAGSARPILNCGSGSRVRLVGEH